MKDNLQHKILIVDDESEMRLALETTLKRQGYQTVTAENGQAGLDLLNREPFDLVITDMRMPKLSGLDLLRAVREKHSKVQVILMTAYGTIDSAVESMKEGAFDYLLKPFSADIIASTVKRAFIHPPSPDSAPLSPPGKGLTKEKKIITRSPEMKKHLQFVENVAFSKSTVLISGESGTGKEMFARYIHQCSPRRDKQLIAVNCAALPEGLLESELFGHEKGAFTGAANKKEGKFELADGGTILLDEITEMSMPLQAKLLRVLQEHEIDRVGGREPIPVDVRVVATTNRDVKERIRQNEFREDLFYRLNVIPLNLPPLRDRREDIPHLAEYFLRKHCPPVNKNITSIAPETITLLKKYRWSGNVRELENTIERAVLLCQIDTLQPTDLFMEESPVDSSDNQKTGLQGLIGSTLQEMEKQLIMLTLKETHNNKTRCAETLGISIRTLRNKLAEYDKENSG
tara:strand:- start:595 stop:1971 length:1377 start_codon:yes stop_codon:yes gene_type:complete